MKNLKIQLFILSISLFIGISVSAQNTSARLKQYNLDDNLALEGFDPVSYFIGKPMEGLKNINFKIDGIIYRFATAENLAAFKQNPEKYQPQYGGWCAYAMGNSGEKVEVDPKTFKIIDGKLYLFYNKYFNNTLNSWNKNQNSLKAKADVNWAKFIH